ncbi:MAG: alpha/beta fold hydrolase [Promethearchaeota archaeon]|nr:MAG: alpha/beta fold hydrolase [Candidatus Lokiarchaeota archaeon]
MTRKTIGLGAIALVFFCSGIVIFAAVPVGMARSYNNYTTTDDGVRICYDLFEPKDDTSTNKTAVILGHGVMVNKNFLRLIALDLAEQGFVVAALDFRGHGRSGGTLERGMITDDILAVKNVLAERGDINMSNLGYLGYSMGGGAGFTLLDTDGGFKAMVSLAAGGRNESTTPNLLILQGKWDEAISTDRVYAYMENKTGLPVDLIEEDRIYGSFANGTALKFHITPTDHLLAPFAQDNIIETRRWFVRALMFTSMEDVPSDAGTYFSHLFGVLLALLGGFGAFLLTARGIVSAYASHPAFSSSKQEKGKDNEKEKEKGTGGIDLPLAPMTETVDQPLKSVVGRYWLWVLPLSIPCIVFVAPLFLLPLYYMNLFVALLMGPSIAVLFYQIYLARKRKIRFRHVYASALRSTSWKNLGVGVGLGFLAYGALLLSINLIFGIVPAITKWCWSVLYIVVIIFLNLNFSLFFQGYLYEKIGGTGRVRNIKMLALSFVMRFVPISLLVLVSVWFFGSWFNVQFLIPLAPLLILMDLTSNVLYRHSRDLLIATIANSVFLTLILITLAYI